MDAIQYDTKYIIIIDEFSFVWLVASAAFISLTRPELPGEPHRILPRPHVVIQILTRWHLLSTPIHNNPRRNQAA